MAIGNRSDRLRCSSGGSGPDLTGWVTQKMFNRRLRTTARNVRPAMRDFWFRFRSELHRFISIFIIFLLIIGNMPGKWQHFPANLRLSFLSLSFSFSVCFCFVSNEAKSNSSLPTLPPPFTLPLTWRDWDLVGGSCNSIQLVSTRIWIALNMAAMSWAAMNTR